MKYIRTKNRIIKVEKEVSVPSFLKRSKKAYQYNIGLIVGDQEIINQADTIEELCDEFVFINQSKRPFVTNDFEYAIRRNDIFKEEIIYGAIWTDKGLIYVAKMNEKGELELL